MSGVLRRSSAAGPSSCTCCRERGSSACPTSYAPSLELLTRNRDRLLLDRIVTHRLPLEGARAAVELAQRDEAMKVVLDPAL